MSGRLISIRFCLLGALLLVIFGVKIFADSSEEKERGYEEECSDYQSCNFELGLRCYFDYHEGRRSSGGKCRCKSSDKMIYDKPRNKCVLGFGQKCRTEETSSEESVEEECESGMVCNHVGMICSCPPGTNKHLNKTECYPVKTYGEQCSVDEDCDTEKMHSCVDGACGCDSKKGQIINPKAFSYFVSYKTIRFPADCCVGKVGAECSHSLKKYCVQNAKCNEESKVCECPGEFTITSELLCGLGHDKPCGEKDNSLEVCSDQFVCTGFAKKSNDANQDVINRCKCRNPDFQEYDTTSKTCRGKVGSPCDPDYEKTCPDKALCVTVDGILRCDCDDGYVVTKSLKCQRAFGQSCDYGGHSESIPTTELCDEVPDLKCIDGTCRCSNEVDVYEKERRTCSTGVGFNCWATSECVSNAVCEGYAEEKGFPGRCVCKDGFHVQWNRSCGLESD